jgi:hypothetical protein
VLFDYRQMQGKLEWDILTVIETLPGRCLLSTVTVSGDFNGHIFMTGRTLPGLEKNPLKLY